MPLSLFCHSNHHFSHNNTVPTPTLVYLISLLGISQWYLTFNVSKTQIIFLRKPALYLTYLCHPTVSLSQVTSDKNFGSSQSIPSKAIFKLLHLIFLFHFQQLNSSVYYNTHIKGYDRHINIALTLVSTLAYFHLFYTTISLLFL